MKGKRAYKTLKRMLDLFFSLLLIVLLALPLFLIWAAVRIDSSGGGIFKQERVGRNGKCFVCYKFRTMYTSAPRNVPTAKLHDPERYVTRVGGFLRRTSLDELPQLFNVLKGDMSIVGPRPLILNEEKMHIERLRMGVYSLRPGLTGLSQINGRDMLCDEEKLRYDKEYLRRFGLGEDARIIARTVSRVLKGDGVLSCEKKKF